MKEQSDTPRTDSAAQFVSHFGWQVHADFARTLERELATATRERDEARALNVEWSKKAETWLATPEAAQRLQSYRDLGQQVAQAQNERDEARAEVERLRKTLDEIATYWNGSHRPAETLDAAEWTRGVAEEALAATEARPVNPDGLPTYDKEKALEWVAQLRDGNKEAKP